MMKVSEPEIRELLQQRASQFSMAHQLPPDILRMARRRRSRAVVLTGAAVLAIGALGALSVPPQVLPSGVTVPRSAPRRDRPQPAP